MAGARTRRLNSAVVAAGTAVLFSSQTPANAQTIATPTATTPTAAPAATPATAATSNALFAQSPETLGCFHFGYVHKTLLQSSVPISEKTAEACQAKCASTTGCKFFTFQYQGPETYRCDFAPQGALLSTPDDPAEGNNVVSGPAVCPPAAPQADWVDEGHPVTSACTSVPTAVFPGSSAAESAAAFGGEVPTMGQCWPHTVAGEPMACPQQQPTVLEDLATGWPGACGNLMQMSTITTQAACKDSCWKSPLCSIWQFDGAPNAGQCWQGEMGSKVPYQRRLRDGRGLSDDNFNCYQRENFKPTASQRIMHGTYRVLMDLKGIQIKGLTLAFDTSVFQNATAAAAHCRLYCIGQLTCQWWQYNEATGCWAEDIMHFRVPYPLINNPQWMDTGSDIAKAVIAGEYIQHFCGGATTSRGVQAAYEAHHLRTGETTTLAPATPSATPTPAPYIAPKVPTPQPTTVEESWFSGNRKWYIVGGIAVFGLVALGVGAVVVMASRKKSAGKGRKPGPSKGDFSHLPQVAPSGAGTQLEDTAPLLETTDGGYGAYPQYEQPNTQYNTQNFPTSAAMSGQPFSQPSQQMPATQYAMGGQGYPGMAPPSYTPQAAYGQQAGYPSAGYTAY